MTTPVPPLADIQPFTWKERVFRNFLCFFRTLPLRLPSPYAATLLMSLALLSFICLISWLLLLARNTIVRFLHTLPFVQAHPNSDLVFGTLSILTLSVLFILIFRKLIDILVNSRIGPLSHLDYNLIETIAKSEPLWQEQVIEWAMVYPQFDERHLRSCMQAWKAKTGSGIVFLNGVFAGTHPLDLFDFEGRKRLHAKSEAQKKREHLSSIAAQQRQKIGEQEESHNPEPSSERNTTERFTPPRM